jgi:hypothetical protein
MATAITNVNRNGNDTVDYFANFTLVRPFFDVAVASHIFEIGHALNFDWSTIAFFLRRNCHS